MAKHVIHIFGASGSGTSTLGESICRIPGFTWMDTDDYFWVPTNPRFTLKRPKEERLALIREDIARAENVVLSGALCGWGDPLMPLFTLAVRVNTDTDVRIARIREREKARFGDRIAPGGDMYAQHQAFVAWASRYDDGGLDMRSRAEHDLWEKQLPCPHITLDGAKPIEENLAAIWAALEKC